MEPYVIWLIAALILAGLEMLSGGFYLLIYGVAAATAALAAWLGLGEAPQFIVAALVAVCGTLVLRQRAASSRQEPLPDLGQAVTVEQWLSATRVRVRHRGTQWDAELNSPAHGRPTTLYICGQRGNTLLLQVEPI